MSSLATSISPVLKGLMLVEAILYAATLVDIDLTVTSTFVRFSSGVHNRLTKTERQRSMIKRRLMTTKPITSRSSSRLDG